MSNYSGSTFLQSLMKFSIASWITAAIGFVSVPIVTRAFSPAEFGKINMFTLSVTIITILVGLSMDQSYFRFFKENNSEESRKEMLTQLMSICCIAYVIYLLFNILFGKALSFYLFDEFNFLVIFIALPIMVLMTIILSYQNIYFRMGEKALGFTILSVLTVFTNKIFLVSAALFRPTYTLGILFTVLGTLLIVFGCKFFSKRSFDIKIPILNKKKIIPYLKYSLPLIPVSIFVFLNSAVIRFLLKDYLSYTALGIFTASVTVAGLLSIIQSGFATYWTPFMYANYETNKALIKKIHSGISFLMISFSIFLILFGDFIFVLLGREYRSGKEIFALLLISPVVYTISETTCYGIYISKKTHLQIYCTVFSFLVNAILGFILIPSYGIFGAAITNAAGGIAFFLTRTYFGLREYDSAEKFYRTLCAIGVLVSVCLINYWISEPILKKTLITILLIIIFLMYRDILGKLRTMLNLIYHKNLNMPKTKVKM
jgi:O-antigen/teichoic acid export membrane protein